MGGRDPAPTRFMRLAIFLLAVWSALAAPPTADIKVDQAGYLPSAPKLAFVTAPAASGAFTLRRASGDAVVFRGTLGSPSSDELSGDTVRTADFTSFKNSGTYYLDVAGVGRSWDFAIGPAAFARAWYLAMRSFYGQRCGIAVDLGPEFPGFQYGACHLDSAWHASSGKSGKRAPGKGWHDAGDYGRYVVNSGISTGTLLWTYELFAARVGKVKLNLPESGNGTPDILNEIRWNLEWMLDMQDEDGGAWHKQTSERFCGFVMPDKDALVSYVIGTGAAPFKSTCATADLAAVMAIAARVYKPFDAAFSARCLKAARQAFTWAEKNPEVRFRNPQGVSTGGYGDGNCSDELLWAAAELQRTTGDAAYHRYFLDHYAAFKDQIRPPSWPNVGPLALWTYLLGKGPDVTAGASLREATLKAADAVLDRAGSTPYRTAMTRADYVWGSNSVAANYGLQLLVANALKPDARYRHAALDHLHYLLGRNAVSTSFVTAVGANAYQHPHHRPSGADGIAAPWPGLLSGGPNRSKQDPAMRNMPDLPPAKMWLDDQASYASNEICINWNAPLVFLLAGALE
jgi:endoglucanase